MSHGKQLERRHEAEAEGEGQEVKGDTELRLRELLEAEGFADMTILVIERPEAGGHAEYMRLRGIAQTFAHEFVYPDGYASLFEGEPEFYGIVNALLVKVCQVYGDPNSDKCKKEEGGK